MLVWPRVYPETPAVAADAPRTRPALSRGELVAAFAVCALAVFSRKPALLVNAQFWGDEARWFQNAHETGALSEILAPSLGYLCVYSKLALLPALAVPLRFAPVALGVWAIATQAVVATFLLTGRFAHIAPLRGRLMVTAAMLALPHIDEIITANDTQWMLALLGLAILVASPPKTRAWRVFDVAAVALMSVTGPFSLFLLPLGLIRWATTREPWLAVLLAVIAGGAGIQAVMLTSVLSACVSRPFFEPALAIVLGSHVGLFGATLNGALVLQRMGAAAMPIAIVACGAAAAVLVYGAARGSAALRMLVAFGVLVFVAVCQRLACDPGWTFEDMTVPGFAGRYWYLPKLVIAVTFIWMLGRQRPLWSRAAAGVAFAAIAILAAVSWQFPPWPDQDFQKYAAEYQRAAPGTIVTIPVNAPRRTIQLTRR
jgi:hypothetical protein